MWAGKESVSVDGPLMCVISTCVRIQLMVNGVGQMTSGKCGDKQADWFLVMKKD